MGFLFRKYTRDLSDEDVSRNDPETVEPEEKPQLEFTLFPPSPKAQIVLIAVGFFLFNIALTGIFAFLVYNYR